MGRQQMHPVVHFCCAQMGDEHYSVLASRWHHMLVKNSSYIVGILLVV